MLLNKSCLNNKTSEFIVKAQKVHGDKYDYSKTVYVNSATKVEIVCKVHGSFFQTPNKHISAKTGCPECASERTRQLNSNIKLQNFQNWVCDLKVRFPQFTYYSDEGNCEISVHCKEHGTTRHKYIAGNKNLYPCRLCGIRARAAKLVKTNSAYIVQARAVHNGIYEYEEFSGVLHALCSKHGSFPLTGNRKQNHINRQSGCPSCKREFLQNKFSTNLEDFIKQASKQHKNKYTYSMVSYVNTHTKINITCPIHGVFLQTPLNHLQGAGCPACKSSKGEQFCRDILTQHEIVFEEQKTFDHCVNPKTNKKLKFDFYIPKFNVLIEIDGIHHFQPTAFGGNVENAKELFVDTQYRDLIKNEFAISQGISLYRIPYTDTSNIQPLIQELINMFK